MIKGKARGIGGIFFKCQDPVMVKKWYEEQLGLETTEYGSTFEFRKSTRPDEIGYLKWSTFSEDTDYFSPSDKVFTELYKGSSTNKE